MKESIQLKCVLKGKIRQRHGAAARGWNGWWGKNKDHVSTTK